MSSCTIVLSFSLLYTSYFFPTQESLVSSSYVLG